MQKERVKHSSRNATSTWSGFSHQGKVGILIALLEMERLGPIDDDELQKWHLEYEVSEDITIWNNDTVASRHQVKANNSSGHLYSTYSAAIDKFECADTPEDARFLHTTREVVDFQQDNTNKVKLYSYPDGKKYCRLAEDQCFTFCVDAIGRTRTGVNKEFSMQICYALMGLVSKQVAMSHNSIGGGAIVPAKIDFLAISQMIHTSSVDKIIDEAHEARLKNTLVKAWDGLREAHLEVGDEINEGHVLRVNSIVASINKMDYGELMDFLKFIHPDLDFAKNINVDEGGFRDVFIKVISECIPEFNIESGTYSIENRRYIPTTITRVDSVANAHAVAKAIINNHDADSKRWLFEKSSVINLNIEGNLMALAKSNRVAHEPTQGREHIMAYTDSSLIKIDSAIKEINAGAEA